jgi:hypothetical protein
MIKYQDEILERQPNNGMKPVASAAITVRVTATGALAAIYLANDVTQPKLNPFYPDPNGNYSFFAPNDEYTIEAAVGSKVIATIGPLTMYDPDDDPLRGVGSFTQTGSGAVLRTMQDKMRESISVKDFGAGPGAGVTATTDAILKALDALKAAGGGELILPSPGNYNIQAGMLSIEGVPFTLRGAGSGLSRLYAAGGTGNMLTITQDDFNDAVCVRDLSFLTNGQETQTGLQIIGNATDSQLNRVQARCSIERVEFRGNDVTAHGFQYGLRASNVHNLGLERVFAAGRRSGPSRAQTTHMVAGIELTGDVGATPSDFTVHGCYVFHAQNGFVAHGAVEGVNFSQCYAVAVDNGFYSDRSTAGMRPWTSIKGCHAAVFIYGVRLINAPQSTISHSLLYKREDANADTIAVALTDCDLSTVDHNIIYNAAASYSVNGDFIGVAVGGASNYVKVSDNTFDRVKYGTNLVGSCQNTKLESNVVSTLHGSGAPQEYLNQSSGSGNTRLNNPRFENSQKNGGAITLNSSATMPLVLISPDTAEIGDEFLITAQIHVTKDAAAGGVKVYLAKTSGTAVPVFQNGLAQANDYCYLAAGTDGYITMSTLMKITTGGSLTLTLSGATNAGGASLAADDAQISILRR